MSRCAGGLQLLLNTELNEYLGVIPEAGFILMAHHPRVQPDITQDGIMLPLRSTTYISLRKVKNKAAEANDTDDRVLTEVIIHYETVDVMMQIKSPKITPSGLVSNLGSILSMYVGFSFLLVFNVVDVMARSMCARGQQRGPPARSQ
ncbi:hypothetical protein IscW_ISCW006559 [Ixodes scapularis]|uniref:Uncharacterized protein n=1 Tax=Ixodes scapularis TaxID=6945 RepID=B7PPR1_IXOSC|nr:hypothetical protein IscW_ISCW006559 [Ixodes scapularis]|eukprot:XP_002435753.1 hypothetical protein IscW_ISCW006559 [Ixodes scapularis]